jgi:phospholipase C
MQENHTFDNYFGTYPTANGTLVNSITSSLQAVNGIADNVCLPYQGSCVSPHYAGMSNTGNSVEGQATYEELAENLRIVV